MLHVHGGSVVLDKLAAAGIPGEYLAWCDVLCQGPAPAGLAGDAWRTVRAAFLDESFGPPEEGSHRARLEHQDRRLERFADHDEVVLWFGPDFFCQAILIYLLDWFAARELDRTRLSLVSVGHYPGVDDRNSCTLAFLPAEALHDVFRRRGAVTTAQRALARRAWEAVRSPTPTDVEAVVRSDNSPLPFLKDALLRHLQEFPSVEQGLAVTEARLLEIVRAGERNPARLFEACQRTERRRWMTDLLFFTRLRLLARGPAPLLALSDTDWFPFRYPESLRRLERATVDLTPDGAAVLAGRKDWVALGGVDRWVGGVRLSGPRVWRWNPKRARLVAP